MINYGKRIVTYSYHNGEERMTKQEIEEPFFTTKETVLKDIIDSLKPLTSNETTCIDLRIKVDSKGRWVIEKRRAIA